MKNYTTNPRKNKPRSQSHFLKIGPLKAHYYGKATDDEFFQFVSELAKIYNAKKYRETGNYDILKDSSLLFKDFKQWLLKKGPNND